MTDTAAIIQLEREYPDWMVYRAADRMCYAALRHSEATRILRGEDWTDLRDELRGWIGRQQA